MTERTRRSRVFDDEPFAPNATNKEIIDETSPKTLNTKSASRMTDVEETMTPSRKTRRTPNLETKGSRSLLDEETTAPNTINNEIIDETSPKTLNTKSANRMADVEETMTSSRKTRRTPNLETKMSRSLSDEERMAPVPETMSRRPDGRQKLEERLSQLGYMAPRWAFTQDQEGREAPGFIVANLLGDTVFIDLDTNLPKINPVDSDLKTRKKIIAEVSAPLEDTDLTVCGEACMAGGKICTVNRNPNTLDVEPFEFSILSHPTEESISVDDPAIKYPSVRLSQIEANNELMMRHISQKSKKYRQEATAKLWERQLELKSAAETLAKVANSVSNIANGKFSKAHDHINKYYIIASARKETIDFPPLEHQMTHYNETMRLMSLCNKKFETLVIHSGHLANLTHEINNISNELLEISDKIEEECQ